MATGRAAFIELVRHAPWAFGRAVGPAIVRVLEVVLAQILTFTCQQNHLGAVFLVLGIQRLRRALCQVQAFGHDLGRQRLVLATAARVGRTAPGDQYGTQHQQGGIGNGLERILHGHKGFNSGRCLHGDLRRDA